MANILVVDVDSRVAEAIGNHFRAAGHAYLTADSGQKALELAKSRPVDVILTEVMMSGGISGFEVCRRIRSDSDLFLKPVLLMSAMANEEEVMHGLAQGADDYIRRPFDARDLVSHVEAVLRANENIAAKDALTSLPAANATKREVQKRICRHDNFGVVYIEIMRIRDLAKRHGADVRSKAIQYLSHALSRCAKKLKPDDFMLGHMGSGHFVCLMRPEHTQGYCEGVLKIWHANAKTICEELGLAAIYEKAPKGPTGKKEIPLLDLLGCVVARGPKDATASQEIFETLSQIRKTAIAKDEPGIYYDRRTIGQKLSRDTAR